MLSGSDMPKYDLVMIRIIALFAVCIALCMTGEIAKADHDEKTTYKNKILIISSYHQDYPWNEFVIQGIRDHLAKIHFSHEAFYEFIDSRHFKFEMIEEQFSALIKAKYFKIHRPDLVVAIDNQALNFVLSHREALFASIPVVFGGINHFQESMIEGVKDIQGVREDPAIIETLALMLALHPETKKIHVLGDMSDSGISVINEIKQKTQEHQFDVQIDFFFDWDFAELKAKIESIDSQELVLATAFFNDRYNNYYPPELMTRWLSEKAISPVYTMWEQYLQLGLTGGVVISGEATGQLIAQIAEHRLKQQLGTETLKHQKPLIENSPNLYMLNYNAVKKFQIRKELAPEAVALVNQSETFYEKYKKRIWITIAYIFIQSVFILYLLFNIRKRSKLEIQLAYRADYDSLTGLLNRFSFDELLRSTILESEQRKEVFFVLFIDLNKFKLINDGYGHHVGDKVLVAMASRIADYVGSKGIVARLSGDEFTAIINDKQIAEKGQFEPFIVGFEHIIQKPLEIDDHLFHLQVSIGVAIYPNHGMTGENLMRHADMAMYQAKLSNKKSSDHCFFSKEFSASLRRRRLIEMQLKNIIGKNELYVVYQPIVNQEGVIESQEALLRWNSPSLGEVFPQEFIPIAEETGWIEEIGDWVIQEVSQALMKCLGAGRLNRIAINVSFRQFQDKAILKSLSKAIGLNKNLASMMTLEITERLLVESIPDTLSTFKELKSLGVRLSIDDFGTGYSSLSYLSQYPFDQLKIDRSFIVSILDNPQQIRVVQGIVSISKTLGISVIAEGVENHLQFELLKEIGIDKFQGNFFGKPKRGQKVDALNTCLDLSPP